MPTLPSEDRSKNPIRGLIPTRFFSSDRVVVGPFGKVALPLFVEEFTLEKILVVPDKLGAQMMNQKNSLLLQLPYSSQCDFHRWVVVFEKIELLLWSVVL